jgi:hypothetical protein
VGREFEMERRFSEDLDRILAGDEITLDDKPHNDDRADLEFARKMIEHRVNPSPSFEARLREKLLSRLEENEARTHQRSFWTGIVHAFHKPAWSTILPVTLALVLIFSIVWNSGILPFNQSPGAEAASIAENNPLVHAAFGDEKIEVTQVLMVIDDQGTVLMQSKTKGVATTVDLNTREVTEVVQVHIPESTAEDEQTAINVVQTDPRTKELLDQGAVINRVTSSNSLDIRYVPDSEGQSHPQVNVKLMGVVHLKLKGEDWNAIVDLESQRLLNVHLARNTGFIRVTEIYADKAVPVIAVLSVVLLFGLLRKNRWATFPAGILSIILGILGIVADLYTNQYSPVKLIPLFLVSLIGLVSGITGLKQTRKWVALTGIALCVIAVAFEVFQIVIAIVR